MISPVDLFYVLFLCDKILVFGTTRTNAGFIQYKNASGAIRLYGHTMGTGSHYKRTIHYDFCLNKFIICCLLIVSKVDVKFMYGVY